MNENSYLNPTNIQEESNSAISKLEKDNEAIRIAESSLNTFFNDNEIQSEAFASLRQQMSDYMAVLQAMRITLTPEASNCFAAATVNR